ncbi:RNA ligase (ATP) [Curtobacterium sp. MCBD17_040]|uniref:RNA ligase (ATP) n=1 Tax=Curtobacterium sp. MCBD17_040 TaxID=2175674 RepID=UPI000DA83D9A|nr:RNA ligase (ATP) [Curtobacterium sp. MCBD17_040]WIB65439.1 RNA ligase (ATP) [Curtobacterium sp. MCBD17_040]
MTDILIQPPTTERALATVETILDVQPIPDADAIERVRVRGWDVVVKKGEFSIGDPCVYIEVDSHLDTTDPRFAFLAPRGVRTDALTGFTGHVLKTAKLRGQYSQGIVFPLSEFPEVAGLDFGTDVTDVLRVRKWDPPLPAGIAGDVAGNFPAQFPKTDEERIQNVSEPLRARDVEWVATEKVDGTSMTVFILGDQDGVAGRNYEFKRNEDHSMWKKALELDLHNRLRSAFPDANTIALQGELFGPGIQKNPLQLRDVTFAAFTLIVDGQELPRDSWPQFVLDIAVPVYDLPYPHTSDEALAQVDGLKSLVNPQRNAEGVVWRAKTTSKIVVDGKVIRASWKAISNKYAMKNDA